MNKNSLEWIKIRGNCGYWFSPSSMGFFNSRVYWNTLTELPNGYLFISSEQDITAWNDERRYTIRKVNTDYGIATIGEFGQYATLKKAKKGLAELVADQPRKFDFWFLTGEVVKVRAATEAEALDLVADGDYEVMETQTRLQGVY